MDRRIFIKNFGWLSAATAGLPWDNFSGILRGLSPEKNGELQADLVIIGGGVGGCAAALAGLRNGLTVVMTEPTSWIGGQLTQQAVPPDEHRWMEKFGGNAAYREFRDGVRKYYRKWYPLTSEAREQKNFDPGNCAVSPICHEPPVALAVLRGMLTPYQSNGRLTLMLHTEPEEAEVNNDAIRAIRVRHKKTGNATTLVAPYFVDASELGDLLPLTGTEYITGAEGKANTGELHTPEEKDPHNMQAMTWCYPLDYLPGAKRIIEKPGDYEFWKDFVPDLTPSWPGKLLNLAYSNPSTLEPRQLGFDPGRDPEAEHFNLWVYRRLYDPGQYENEGNITGTTLVNWPQNDYLLGNILEVDEKTKNKHLEQARQLSFSLLYWLQTEVPRPDGKAGWPGLGLRPDLTGTEDGLAMYPYVREARRIKAEFTIKEQDVGLEARMEATGLDRESVTAASYHDSVGVGSYHIDLHPSTGGDNYIDFPSLPFEIPLGALIPQRMENLLPACKNIGTTHITNGCYRLHPVEWNIGEAVGLLAYYCKQKQNSPKSVRNDSAKLEDFQRFLHKEGVETKWPEPRHNR